MKKDIYFILVVFCCVKANAWGSKGHAMVAQVAFTYLDPATQKNVMSYLYGMTIDTTPKDSVAGTKMKLKINLWQ